MEDKVSMKVADYSVGDKCIFYHEGKNELEEITIDEMDLHQIAEYEGTTFEGLWYRPLEKK